MFQLTKGELDSLRSQNATLDVGSRPRFVMERVLSRTVSRGDNC